jgi:DNA adenine methylase
MFRYNSSGDFNVPYGGIAYNRKNFLKKVDYLRTKELKSLLDQTKIENLDFEDFFNLHTPTKKDFIFLDPPYDTEFSTYAQNEFTKTDQIRLADYLTQKCKAKWMMIIKNTDFIYSLYDNKELNIKSFDKTYLVSFMNRNDKNVEHLLITNY